MATKAPRPGTSRRAKQTTEAQRVMVIRLEWCDETHRIAVANIPFEQRTAVRAAFPGLTLNNIISAFDTDTLAVLVWIAKRMHGKPSLPWSQFAQTWPDPVDPTQIDVWAEDADGFRIDADGTRLEALEAVEVDDPES